MTVKMNSPSSPDLVLVAKALGASGGDWMHAARTLDRWGARDRAVDYCKSKAIGALDPSAFVGWATMFGEWSATLRGRSVFFGALQAGLLGRAPMRTRLLSLSASATAYMVGQGLPKPLSAISLDANYLTPVKAAAIIAVSDEVLREPVANSVDFFSDELRGAVADVVDEWFVETIWPVGGPYSTGTSGDPQVDVDTLVDQVNVVGGAHRLFFVAGTDVQNLLTRARSSAGVRIFPDVNLGQSAGSILGVPLLVTGIVGAAGTLSLVDGNGIVAAADGMELDTSNAAALEFEDTPTQSAMDDSPGPTPAQLVSLWQTGATAIRAEVSIAAEKHRAGAVAIITSIDWNTSA